MEAEEFLDAMMLPEAGDTMAFQIDRAADDGLTFSMEAMDALAENVKTFAMARTFARWKQTGKAPTKMTAMLTVKWEPDPDDLAGPWWQLNDDGATVLDGTHRINAKEGRR